MKIQNTEAELLKKLAETLGTTVDYLWSVLINQAPISSTVTIFQFLLIGLSVFFWFKMNSKFMDTSKQNKSLYGKYEEALIIPMGFVGLFLFIMVIVCFFEIDNVINGYFNPEYWALRKVAELIK